MIRSRDIADMPGGKVGLASPRMWGDPFYAPLRAVKSKQGLTPFARWVKIPGMNESGIRKTKPHLGDSSRPRALHPSRPVPRPSTYLRPKIKNIDDLRSQSARSHFKRIIGGQSLLTRSAPPTSS
jgi:hypothetical protein